MAYLWLSDVTVFAKIDKVFMTSSSVLPEVCPAHIIKSTALTLKGRRRHLQARE